MGRPKLTESAKKRRIQDRNRVSNSKKLACGRHWDRLMEFQKSSNIGHIEIIGHLLEVHDKYCNCKKQESDCPFGSGPSQDIEIDQQAALEATPKAYLHVSSPSCTGDSSSSWSAEQECPMDMGECNMESENGDARSHGRSCFSDTGAVIGDDFDELDDDDLLNLQSTENEDYIDDDDMPDSTQPLLDIAEAKKVIAFVDPILDLVKESAGSVCRKSRCDATLTFVHRVVGTALHVRWTCGHGHVGGTWASQPKLKKMFAGDLQLASNILLTGNAYKKTALLFHFMNLGCVTESTFHQIQRLYAVPAVERYWKHMQTDIITQKIRLGVPTKLAGDGRNDSPGYSAQFCTYSFADIDTGNIVHLEVVDVRQATSSVAMEKTAFTQGLQYLMSKLNVEEIVTDQNPSVTKLLKSSPQILHQFDIWHAAKNLEKRLISACGPRSLLRLWISSVKNHFWWSSETCKGSATAMKEKWVRVLCHVCNIHEWSTGSCMHAQLDEEHQQPWLDKKGEEMSILRSVVLEPRFLKLFPYFRNYRHTGDLESFQNHILMYCPKRNSYQYHSYRARNLLAAIDHNHHVNRPEYRTKAGNLKYYANFNPRSRKWTPKLMKIPKDYSYRFDLQLFVFEERVRDQLPMRASRPRDPMDPKLIQPSRAKIPCPPVPDLVSKHVSKFK